MQHKYLQRLIRQNASYITNVHLTIEETVADAKFYKGVNEISFSAAHYKHADKLRAELAKAVETQKALKAELEEGHNIKRIENTVAKLCAKGVSLVDILANAADATKTTGEKLNALRDML